MKMARLIVVIVFTSFNLFAQTITGQWNGVLKIMGTQMRLAFNISKTDSGYTATMDSPDQKVKGIPVTSTNFDNAVLKLIVKNAGIEYEGTLNKENPIIGTFKQAGQSFPMNLSREEIQKEEYKRTQEPIKPYPYYSEEVTFENKTAGIVLAGTLTLPKKEGNFPAVVLISGSGAQNRNEELLGHKPFLVLADYLTKNGIAVLRFDDRGTAESKGDFKTATSQDFSTDVEAAVNYLNTRKEINQKKMGLMGHSEGGTIAPMVAAKHKDIAFIVLLAGTGISGDEILLLQQELIGKVAGTSKAILQKTKTINRGAYNIIIKSVDQEKLKGDLFNYYKQAYKDNPDLVKPNGMTEEKLASLQVEELTKPWMEYFIKYNPATALEKVKCPVLAIDGEKDLQVPAKINLDAIKKALEKGGNKNITTKELPNLNHLFQDCTTGSLDEYGQIEQTFSPSALNVILSWIQLHVK